MAIIEVNTITKRFGTVTALSGVSLAVQKGVVFGFLGPNGAGKTTLIRILAGLITPDEGSFRIAGKGNTMETKQHVGYLAQSPRFYRWLTARELLKLSGNLHGMEARHLDDRIDSLLELCGIANVADRRIGGFSGGMRQRLGIAQAIIHEPDVVFLDEPVSALDPQGRKEVLDLIDSLRESTTVFMSSHILDDVQRVCDEVAIIKDGAIRIHEKTKRLLQLHARPVLIMTFDSHTEGQAASDLCGELGIETTARGETISMLSADYDTNQRKILDFVGSHGLKLKSLMHQEATLEDVFMHHMREEYHD